MKPVKPIINRVIKVALVAAMGLSAVALIAETQPAKAQALRVTNVINGTLGDQSFFDSANRGLERAVEELGIELNNVVIGEDQSRWESGLDDAMADVDNYDVLVVGTSQMSTYLAARADLYPDKFFIMYDSGVDYSTCSCANVYSLEFAQNEGSYLAGVYTAAMIADGSVEGLEGDAIGAIGGLDIPVINDFIAGYTQGAQSVNPDIQVLVDYVSGASPFFDPARGKELALAQYEQGAAFIFGIAGGTGQGIIEAAEETGRYTIGVDSDQYLLLAESDPEAAATILTSMMKNVDNTLFRAIDLHIKGELGYGGLEIVGLAEGAVGLAKNDYYNEITPDSVKAIVGEAERGILACEIDVDSALEREDPCTPVEMSEGTMEATPEATASN